MAQHCQAFFGVEGFFGLGFNFFNSSKNNKVIILQLSDNKQIVIDKAKGPISKLRFF